MTRVSGTEGYAEEAEAYAGVTWTRLALRKGGPAIGVSPLASNVAIGLTASARGG